MRSDQFFGALLVLLAIYLALDATGREPVDIEGLFNNDGRDPFNSPGDDRVATSSFCASAPRTSAFVDLGDVHDDEIRCMEYAGVAEGVSASHYAPWDALTRAQAASMVEAFIEESVSLAAPGSDLRSLPPASNRAGFRDVPPDNTHAGAIARLNEAGILEGFVDHRFEPRTTVTRAQAASMLDRAQTFLTGERDTLPLEGDAFNDDDGSLHEESINKLAAADIVVGRTPTRYDPGSGVRRGQMASMLARLMAYNEQAGRIEPLP